MNAKRRERIQFHPPSSKARFHPRGARCQNRPFLHHGLSRGGCRVRHPSDSYKDRASSRCGADITHRAAIVTENRDRISKQLVALAQSVESLMLTVETRCDAELRRSEAHDKVLLTILAIL